RQCESDPGCRSLRQPCCLLRQRQAEHRQEGATQATDMPIHLITDTPARLASVRAVLERNHAVTSELLLGVGIQRSNIEALVVHVDLRSIEKICALKKVLAGMSRVDKRVFLVEDGGHLSATQAYALGATSVLLGQMNPPKLLRELKEQIASTAAMRPEPGTSAA